MRTKDIGEFGLIERIRGKASDVSRNVIVGIGDDCAVVRPDGERDLLFTCDCQIQDVHFRSEWIAPESLGRRVAAVNLSDIASMGGEPLWALCSLAVPTDMDVEWIDALYGGLRQGLGEAGTALVGGNTARLEGRVLVDLFLCGAVSRGKALVRSGARPGDILYVTGSLGGSTAGLAWLREGRGDVDRRLVDLALGRYRTPTARLAEGRAIAASGEVSSCIDVSDGLAQDASHIAEESGVSVRIDADLVPIDESARAIARAAGVDPLAWALYGGEEFELLFTVRPKGERAVIDAASRVSTVKLTRIGEIIEGEPRVVVTQNGAPLAVDSSGWDHFLHL